MARIGFRKAKYNLIDGDKYKALTGSKVPEFEKVVDEKFAPEYNTAELYANDALCESDYSFKKGTLSLTVADDDDTFVAEIMGNTVSTGFVKSRIYLISASNFRSVIYSRFRTSTISRSTSLSK